VFTGIVQAKGRIAAAEPRGGDVRLSIEAADLGLADVAIGDSIAVSGVCLTAVAVDNACFEADCSPETLACTTLGALGVGAAVNLEKSLRLTDRLGGHLVVGHVDGVGSVQAITADARAERWRFAMPAAIARYVATKGSITVDGVSLTVNAVGDDWFEVALIPHTVAVTTFADRREGTPVNLEVDLVARYVERLFGERGAGA
jgi:riboflavin synthase